MFRFALAIVLVILGAGDTKLLAQTLVQRVGSFDGHAVEVWTTPNDRGGNEYFVLAIPAAGPGPHPVLVFVDPYTVLPCGPSSNPDDCLWNSYARQGGPFYDISLRPEWNFRPCDGGSCEVPVSGVATDLSDLRRLADFSMNRSDNASWALAHGYAVAVAFARHYAARDTITVVLGVVNTLEALQRLPQVNASKMAILGRSQGGELAIHALAFPGRPLNLAASVAEAGWADGRDMTDYAYRALPSAQPAGLYEVSKNFFNGFWNRLAAGFGADENGPLWGYLSRDYVAEVRTTPTLVIAGTDDAFVPATESERFYNALRDRGKDALKWIWQNGSAPLQSLSVQSIGHGAMDTNSAWKREALWRLFILNRMPSGARVTVRVPQDLDLVSAYNELAKIVKTGSSRDTENAYALASLLGNPLVCYESSDPRVPSGCGDTVHPYMLRSLFGIQ